jgi:hypothetical protein
LQFRRLRRNLTKSVRLRLLKLAFVFSRKAFTIPFSSGSSFYRATIWSSIQNKQHYLSITLVVFSRTTSLTSHKRISPPELVYSFEQRQQSSTLSELLKCDVKLNLLIQPFFVDASIVFAHNNMLPFSSTTVSSCI